MPCTAGSSTRVLGTKSFEISSEIDFPSAAKLSGSRFVVLYGKIAKLERALKSFMIDRLTNSY